MSPIQQRAPEERAADARSDAELLDALRADDPTAIAALYDRHARLVYGLAVAILKSAEEAEDLTQEVFVALATVHAYDAGRGEVTPFLVTMTRSRAIDRLRARGRHVRLLRVWHGAAPAAPAPPTPPQQVHARELSDRVRAALAQLSEKERQVLELSYFAGLTQTEIAERLDAPLGSVKSWARRGLSSLKDHLEDLV
ncbi:MAG TPA: sigma-70 family RNA polymerase sigma factor [Candidatus Binatia bacterium]|nr:sigma-70 family RNA polymerase sigma factor [Candidatus Binatia bacterium]